MRFCLDDGSAGEGKCLRTFVDNICKSGELKQESSRVYELKYAESPKIREFNQKYFESWTWTVRPCSAQRKRKGVDLIVTCYEPSLVLA